MVRIWIDWLIKRRTQRFYVGEPDDGNRWEEKGTFERAMVVVVVVMYPCFFLFFCFSNFGPLPVYPRRFLLICEQFFVFFFFCLIVCIIIMCFHIVQGLSTTTGRPRPFFKGLLSLCEVIIIHSVD